MSKHQALTEGLTLVFQGIERLVAAFPTRRFTIDGRLVGDVGEVIAELEYEVVLHETSQPTYDGTTSGGRKVQIKATFKDSLALRAQPDYLLGFKLFPNGTFEEVFNGPGEVVYAKYAHRKGIGETQISIPNSALRELSKSIPSSQKISRREELGAG